MIYATGTAEQLLQLRDEDSALHGYPMGGTLRYADVMRDQNTGEHFYSVSEDLALAAERLTPGSRVLVDSAVALDAEVESLLLEHHNVVRRPGEE
jgi:hypothetical protein